MWAALNWEVRVHADMQCSQMQSDAILANPVSVEADMWRVMQHKIICQFCRVCFSVLEGGGGDGDVGLMLMLTRCPV